MATSSQSSVELGSHEVKDYICNACEDQNNVETSADFYCKQCERFYCGNCIDPHGKVFAKHTTFGRVERDKWPVSKKVVDFLQTCDVHKDHKIDQFCNLHKQLCCPQCVSDQHSQCSKVTQISELTISQPTGLEGLSVELETVLGEIKTLQISQKASIQSLQRTYKEHSAVMIEQMRGNLNTYIDECDNNSVGTSGGNEQYLKEEMCRSVLSIVNEFDNITTKELNEMKHEVISIKGSVTSSIHKCTSLHNNWSQFHDIVQKIGDHKQLCLIASIKCKHIIQQALTLLGKAGKAFNVQSNTKHNVRIPRDSSECCITGICVLTDGQVLVADWSNRRVKLLNQQYQVVSPWDVTDVRDMCQITPSEIAVAVDDNASNTHNVQFITVTQSQLTLGRKLELQHTCIGIDHHEGELFICSGTALFKYTLSGKQVCRLYEDAYDTVDKCAVSPTGDRLYIISRYQDKLLTLARDGTLLATYTDPALERLSGLHVTPAGQVLVCGYWSHTVLQVGWEGQSKLATLPTKRHGVWRPWSVCYCSTTSSIIVGQWENDNILVFRVE
ncbi:uncharacterized protein LOC127876370 [Dreissena polymorpha]|uniref:B box-type domain-containing protein n=1 Tax=Dreissena polymorpha TaxID=45954 RepID=A0A9D4MPL7_DREPO|nr:uncharacterized protein LOC127876370 [Dreissena polymorpha]XP_052277517.1 uncharacterized protein LOC127876370 [Dreissena polymorpha]XP_052277526.1 uncharacterized protein LOC127876370 [Dreissena polymorpha]XP_052277534.1 uncharacterized protein LOC127876370 [Dreissena polymorpha]XP_052277543.1 uncharacterized protein LOC127876370 [Dreissena polymorpha]XP_052277551.1 uncharacterized protein LOC127876370 [Dreissena polymorpha]XP_052277561.1 uncharacterized protein LOC127876370 [Dreissena po